MAKRKRLSPATMTGDGLPADLETKAQNGWVGVRPRAPIAEVSRDAAAQSAFDEVAEELRAARAEGRMVVRLPLGVIEDNHLVRDRMGVDDEDMAVLIDSLRDRGQQTPIEVVALDDGGYGLISGWRRLQALRTLQGQSEGSEAFSHVQALIRAPEGAEDAYRAMVEENEVRANLSFYERARIAVKAVEQGVYPNVKTAISALFAAARSAKRSKILSFVTLVQALDDRLRFPTAIPEKLGLTVAQALQSDAALAGRLREALRKADLVDAGTERRVLERALAPEKKAAPASGKTARGAEAGARDVVPGVSLRPGRGSVTLKGAGVDAALIEDLTAWLLARR